MAGQVTVKSLQLGDNATATQNFVWSEASDGTSKLARGNVGVTTQDVLTVASTGKVSFPQGFGTGNTNQSMVRLNTANGYGSTNTAIRRFTNVVTNQGTDITYADSATLGASFTINTAGVYAISYSDQFNAGAWVGISLNSTQLGTTIAVINAADVVSAAVTVAANNPAVAAATLYLPSSSIIRAHNAAGTVTGLNVNTCQFVITRVA